WRAAPPGGGGPSRGGGYRLCLDCDGRGERYREPGDEAWDAYLGLPLETAALLPREPPRGPSAVQAAQDKDEREGRVEALSYGWERRPGGAHSPPRAPSAVQAAQDKDEREGRVEALSYGWERLRDAYDRHGSYRELRTQLRWLRV